MENSLLAHIKQNEQTGEWFEHLLSDHLRAVATLSRESAESFGGGDIAWLLGLCHDLGKATSDFQAYIRRSSGYEPEACYKITGKNEKRHAITGSLYLLDWLVRETLLSAHRIMRTSIGYLLTQPIAGHHAGLPDWNTPDDKGALNTQMQEYGFLLDKILWDHKDIPPEIVQCAARQINIDILKNVKNPVLLGRFLFSSLVDADFLDTEHFYDPAQSDARNCGITLPALHKALNSHLVTLAASAKDSPLAGLRESILTRCREKAIHKPGVFSLTVPTGGGKTLSGMAFALSHAIMHGKRRIIYVIPYTSIIEQNASVFKKAFGDLEDAVLEHHSNIDRAGDSLESDESQGQTGYGRGARQLSHRLATENWDWPVIVTTSVQFFESLFAAKPSRCRKLHNIANSVVVIDEAQMMPPDFLGPICQAIQELVDSYGVTVVLSTATQPALGAKNFESNNFCKGLQDIQEIIEDPNGLSLAFQNRVTITLPDDLDMPLSIEALGAKLSAEQEASWLCIVNTRPLARQLYELLCITNQDGNLFHLSTQMCGGHRQQVIGQIRGRLAAGQPTRVISTQLVEAGVDLDFPLVYRAMSGLDSLAQAAGRCNREGRMSQPGRVEVFLLEGNSPRGHLQQAEAACKVILKDCASKSHDPFSLESFNRYFQELYWSKGDRLDFKKIINSQKEWAYRTVARDFRFIEEAGIDLIVPFDDTAKDLIETILTAVKPDFRWRRRAQRYVVSVPERIIKRALAEGWIVCKFEDLHLLLPGSIHYDEHLGFLPDCQTLQSKLDNVLIL